MPQDVISTTYAIQAFMPGISQGWYPDLFAWVNIYESADLALLAFTVRHRDNSGNESLHYYIG